MISDRSRSSPPSCSSAAARSKPGLGTCVSHASSSTTERRSCGSRGLLKYPSIPARRQRSQSPLMAWAVMAMIRTCVPCLALAQANLGGRFEAVHLRHLDVHQHDIEDAGGQGLDGLPAVLDHRHVVPAFAEQAARDPLVDDVVLGDEHLQQANRRRHEPPARRSRHVRRTRAVRVALRDGLGVCGVARQPSPWTWARCRAPR